MTHKSRIWRDIDKHPLPEKTCKIDVTLECGSRLLNCGLTMSIKYSFGDSSIVRHVIFLDGIIPEHLITQWRDADKGEI